MVIPFTKLLFHVDNGLSSQLSGTGLAAEYDLVSRKLIWRNAGHKRIKKQETLLTKIISLVPVTSPLLIIPFIYFLGNATVDIATPKERLGEMSLLLPVLLGMLIFFGFEYLMLFVRESYSLVEEPPRQIQVAYLTEVNEISWRHNDVWTQLKTPYLANVIIFGFVIGVITPLMFWIYLQAGTMTEMIFKLVVLGILLSIIPNLLWNGIVKVVLLNRLVRKLEGENNEN